MSDTYAWNFRCFQDVGRELGRHWRILERLCCEDDHKVNIIKTWDALERLRELREGWIPDYVSVFYPTKRLDNRG